MIHCTEITFFVCVIAVFTAFWRMITYTLPDGFGRTCRNHIMMEDRLI